MASMGVEVAFRAVVSCGAWGFREEVHLVPELALRAPSYSQEIPKSTPSLKTTAGNCLKWRRIDPLQNNFVGIFLRLRCICFQMKWRLAAYRLVHNVDAHLIHLYLCHISALSQLCFVGITTTPTKPANLASACRHRT